ncbi:hypothetical protein ACJX4N_002507 [Enterococcus faecalis]|uniref:hypothetical protein n=1 Tax=Enterococcus faecalis TaxID=1351 RepID=UPI00139D8617|nr:hypothetical protein [Enterococcus faecalis]EGO5016467.1 hypothetical protein [Enterococcus faecalis]EGO6561338.1 hypothetical protein [Enterococcus faecalis]EGO7560939.1 hypothetical protein [Enterococcus faecalis]EGO7742711.1 hypothetical protein [Enterococcus faecalis]EGO8387396.1 hypothetical protein [Enterococcus faecalis]
MKDIENLAKKFRVSIEKARDSGAFDDDIIFYKFPKGCCGDTSDLLAQFLLENGIKTYYIWGIYKPKSYENIQSHAWLLTDDQTIIDITGDQFREKLEFLNYDNPVYIGDKDDFHSLFVIKNINVNENKGLDALGSISQSRLKVLYQKITNFL